MEQPKLTRGELVFYQQMSLNSAYVELYFYITVRMLRKDIITYELWSDITIHPRQLDEEDWVIDIGKNDSMERK